MRALVVSALALGLMPSALASHPSWRYAASMNLDGDASRERVEATNRVSFDHSNSLARVVFYDVCRGETIEHEAAPDGRSMQRTLLRGSRTLGRPGFLFSIRYASGELIIRVGYNVYPRDS